MTVKALWLFRRVNAGQAAHQRDNGEQRRNALRNQRCPSDTGDTHVQLADKENIQNDIECRRECEEIQRRAAVAQTIENGGCGIVQKQEQQTGNVNAQIHHGRLKNIFRRADELHQSRTSNLADCGQGQCQRNQRNHSGADCGAHAHDVMGTEQLGNNNRTADTCAGRNGDEQNRDRIRRAGCCQSVYAEKTTGDHAVCQIVQLLEHHAQQQRNDKLDQNFKRRALCHVCNHIFPYLFAKRR